MAKDAKGHGSDKHGNAMPIPGHPYHTKSDDQLRYIVSDASAAAKASQGMSSYNPNSSKREDTEGKYLDQANDASTVLGYRARGGSPVQPEPAAHASGVTNVGSGQQFTGSAKVGRAYQNTGPHPDRIAARDAARAMAPKAKSVSTGYGYNGSFDIRSHPNYEK